MLNEATHQFTGQSSVAQQIASSLNLALAQALNPEKFAVNAFRRKIAQEGYNNNRGELPDKL